VPLCEPRLRRWRTRAYERVEGRGIVRRNRVQDPTRGSVEPRSDHRPIALQQLRAERFAVPGIRGAQAAATAAVDHKGFSIAFADGRFWYLVTVFYSPNAAKPPTRTSVIAGARALYRRVHS
jgi:hypothetical protein